MESNDEIYSDVVICGSGSAGLCAATWLSRCGVQCTILESSPGPLKVGKADGVQCRTVEIFESFGIGDQLLRDSYHVNEICFWGSAAEADRGIVRRSRSADTPTGLSHMPHVILNQARMNGLLIGAMEKFNNQKVMYDCAVRGVTIDETKVEDNNAYPLSVSATRNGKELIFRAKYVLGCDGAHSSIRKSLGFKMLGSSTDSIWGVMDVFPRTTFPDIRKKAAVQSEHGSLVLIPREGDTLVRLYIEMPHGTNAKEITPEHLIVCAQRIFAPYTLEIAEIYWWSAYSIGQRLADHFTKHDRVFLTGDACHTHSPKAGQGMNVSLQDGYNIGWKLAHVLKGLAPPDLLSTYELERVKVAADLIAFDRELVKRFSSKHDSSAKETEEGSQAFSDYFTKAARYTAGLTATYTDSSITNAKSSQQSLATGVIVGMRFPSAQVVRHSDSKPVQFMTAIPSDGRWRIIIFGGDMADKDRVVQRLQRAAEELQKTIMLTTREGEDLDQVIETLVLLRGDRNTIEGEEIPDFFRPIRGKWRIRDPHKIYFDDESHNHGHGHAYEAYGVDPQNGALVVVRPDQYVSLVCEIESTELVASFFRGCITRTSDPLRP